MTIDRMGNWSGATISGKLARKWKMVPRLKWPKMAAKIGKMAKFPPKSHFGAHFSILRAISRPFRAWGHLPCSFPVSRDLGVVPVSHSVNGHFNRNFRRRKTVAKAGQSYGGASEKLVGRVWGEIFRSCPLTLGFRLLARPEFLFFP